MVQLIACVYPQAQRWMQVAESGLDRKLPIVRRGYYLKNLPDALISRSADLPINRFSDPPDYPISRLPEMPKRCASIYPITRLPNYPLTQWPHPKI
jgi:hypothetical protein